MQIKELLKVDQPKKTEAPKNAKHWQYYVFLYNDSPRESSWCMDSAPLFDGRCSKALLLGLVILSLLLQQSQQAIDLLQNLGEIRLNMRQQGEQHQVFYRGIQLAKIVIDMGIKWN